MMLLFQATGNLPNKPVKDHGSFKIIVAILGVVLNPQHGSVLICINENLVLQTFRKRFVFFPEAIRSLLLLIFRVAALFVFKQTIQGPSSMDISQLSAMTCSPHRNALFESCFNKEQSIEGLHHIFR